MKKILASILSLLISAGAAHAQGAVAQYGVVVQNNFASWVRNGVIQDSGVNSITLNFPTIAQGHLIGNANLTAQPATDTPLTTLMDTLGSFAQGDILYRNSVGWVFLAPGTSGQYLETLGAGANPTWSTVTIPSITAGAGIGITSGVVSISPQVSVALGGTGLTSGVSGGVPYYSSSSSMAASAALAQYQIVIGGGAGAAPYSLGSAGTSGQLLQSNGAAANPSWVAAPTGSVTSVATGAGLTGGPITTTGTVACVTAASGVEGCPTPDTNAAHFLNGAGAWTTPAGTTPAPLVATSASFAPGSMSAQTCAQQTTTVTGATSSMAAAVSPTTPPASGFVWSSSVTTNAVVINLCNTTSGSLSPTSTTYAIRVIQ
jgi:hypothetical protein